MARKRRDRAAPANASATARDDARRRAIEARAPEIARLRAEARALLDRQPEARKRARSLRALVARLSETWADVERIEPALADQQLTLHAGALARWFVARHHVSPVETHDDAIALLGAASSMNADEVARALLDRPDATADELREDRGDAARKRASRARDRYARAVAGAIEHVGDALAAIDRRDATVDERERALTVGWAVRCLWGAEWLGNADGYARSADAERSTLIAADVVFRETHASESHAGQLRQALVFVAAVAVAHVGPPPEITEHLLAVLAELPDAVIERHADIIVEIVQVVVHGDGATYAAGLDALLG